MKKIILKKIFLIVIILISTSACVFANSYIPQDIEPGLPVGTGNVNDIILRVIGALMWAGLAIGLGLIIYIGIKYVMASADEKASLKGLFTKVIIGIIFFL